MIVQDLLFFFEIIIKLNQEIDQISVSIKDTKLKLGTTQMLNEVYLSQLRTPLAKIDPFFDENRE